MSRELTPEERATIQRNLEAARARLHERTQSSQCPGANACAPMAPQTIVSTSSLLPPRNTSAASTKSNGASTKSSSVSTNAQGTTSQSSQASSGATPQGRAARVVLQMHTARTFSTGQNVDLARRVYSRVPGACYVEAERLWTFPLAQYDAVLVRLADAGVRPLAHDTIPASVLALFRAETLPEPPARSSATGAILAAAQQHRARMADAPETHGTEAPQTSCTGAPQKLSADARIEGGTDPFAVRDAALDERIGEPELASALHLFQRDAVEDIVFRRSGRVLLADDMGLGKTLQAMAVALCFRAEWPLLVVAPASMVATWAEQLVRWAPTHLPQGRTVVLYDGKSAVPRDTLALVASYDIAARAVLPGGAAAGIDFGVVVADESHALKNRQTKRATALLPVLSRARRVVLLSGTPALSRPMELLPQTRAVAPRLYTSEQAFGMRYCAGHRSRFGWDYRGASNLRELELVLRRAVLIRRTKDEVLSQLPPKVRTQRFLAVGRKELEAYRAAAHSERARELYESGMAGEHASAALDAPGGPGAMEIWRQTAEVKLPTAKAYIDDLLEGGAKVLLFGHHLSVLDGLSVHLSSSGVRFIRIDGSTPPARRAELCASFQNDTSVRAAVLSITAASTGLTLTAASVVVFAELFWNPGVLLQAEDRAHRIGQADSVAVHYLLARGTADDHLWPLLQRKLATLEAVGLGRNAFAKMPASNAVPTDDPKQRTLSSFFKTLPKDPLTRAHGLEPAVPVPSKCSSESVNLDDQLARSETHCGASGAGCTVNKATHHLADGCKLWVQPAPAKRPALEDDIPEDFSFDDVELSV